LAGIGNAKIAGACFHKCFIDKALGQDGNLSGLSGTDFAILYCMVAKCAYFDEVNVLASDANWAWPSALRDIFRPRGVNLLVARSASEFVNIIEQKRIHTAIIDMDTESSNGLATIKIIRLSYPLVPCLLLKSHGNESLLEKALELDVFSVIDKPVDMDLLLAQFNRIFLKKYSSDLFAD
jgi:CheY-like chemotaxis protein